MAVDIFAVVEKTEILSSLLPTFLVLWSDETQESVRSFVVNATLELSSKCSTQENKTHTLPIVTAAAQDRSWRVRLTVANKLDEFLRRFGPDLTPQFLMQTFQLLLKDSEADVRAAVIKMIENCSYEMTVDQLINYIVPSLHTLSMDTAYNVRAALAEVLGSLALRLGSEETQELLLPAILELMKDEHFEVRLNVVRHAGNICEVLGVEAIGHPLLETIQSLMVDPQWRIRLSVVHQIPKFGQQLGSELFRSKLENLFLSALADNVHCVREAAIDNIESLADSFGNQWTVDCLLPKIVDRYMKGGTGGGMGGGWGAAGTLGSPAPPNSSSYLTRITMLHTLPKMARVMSAEQVMDLLLPLLLKALKDDVPNVRFAAVRISIWLSTNELIPHDVVENQIKPILFQLAEDVDLDVRYFANIGIEKCGRAMQPLTQEDKAFTFVSF